MAGILRDTSRAVGSGLFLAARAIESVRLLSASCAEFGRSVAQTLTSEQAIAAEGRGSNKRTRLIRDLDAAVFAALRTWWH
jgi:hypothetical protein